MSLNLDKELFNLDLHTLNGALQLTSFVGGDTASDDGATDTTGPSKSNLTRNENIWYVLIFTEKRKVEQDLNGLSIGSHDDHLGDTTIESLGSFVRSLLGLLVVGGLLDQIEEGDGKVGISEGEGFLRHDR